MSHLVASFYPTLQHPQSLLLSYNPAAQTTNDMKFQQSQKIKAFEKTTQMCISLFVSLSFRLLVGSYNFIFHEHRHLHLFPVF